MMEISPTILVPIVLTLLGIAGAYWNGVRTEARKSKIAFVNEQLKNLYGPLFSLSQASEAAWEKFRGLYRPTGAFFSPTNPPNKTELEEWVRWMRVVFTPMNEQMVNTIVEHADLIEGEFSQSFLEMISHVESYKVVMNKWDDGDFSIFTSIVNYPSGFNAEVKTTFEMLKARQQQLMR